MNSWSNILHIIFKLLNNRQGIHSQLNICKRLSQNFEFVFTLLRLQSLCSISPCMNNRIEEQNEKQVKVLLSSLS